MKLYEGIKLDYELIIKEKETINSSSSVDIIAKQKLLCKAAYKAHITYNAKIDLSAFKNVAGV